MHGFVFNSLRSFIVEKKSSETWNILCKEADIPSPLFLPFKSYPDEQILKIIQAGSNHLKMPIPVLLEEFGKHLMKDLMHTYKNYIRPEWDCLEFLLHIESVMHAAAKRTVFNPKDAPNPPILLVKRTAPDQILLKYKSTKRLCSLAKGLLYGAGQYYHTRLNIIEESCMHRGDASCLFRITKL